MTMTKTLKRTIVGLAVAAAMTATALAQDISGAGSSFVFPILSKWSANYTGGPRINYQSIGSGGGIAQIKAKTVTFGASDMPLSEADLNKFGLTQFPVIVGGIVVVYNLPGVPSGSMTLDSATLSGIFQGKITRWNDAAISRLNPGVKLPNQAIAVVHRSDGSGTSFIFTNYLSHVNAEWKENVGAATAVDWPTGIGAKGNEGVAGNVAQTSGAIGYVEYAYAKQNHLSVTKLVNHDGKVLSPGIDTFAAAASNADWAGAAGHGYNMVLVDQPGAAAWPITGATWAIFYKQPQDPAATAAALKFFKWAFSSGKAMASSLDYVPLPDNAVASIQNSWKQIQGAGM